MQINPPHSHSNVVFLLAANKSHSAKLGIFEAVAIELTIDFI